MTDGKPRTDGKPKGLERPRFDQDAVLRELQAYNRNPFLEIMAYFVGAAPESHRLQEFANEHPDKWSSALKSLSGLSGFHDRLEITGNIAIEVQNMGDAELLARLQDVQEQLRVMEQEEASAAPLLELEASEAPSPEGDPAK